MYWDIKKLSEHLNIKISTLYAWAAQGRIPHVKIHGLIRFDPEEIKAWLAAFKRSAIGESSNGSPKKRSRSPKALFYKDLDHLIERAKKTAYNEYYGIKSGETRPASDPGKEEDNGSV
ncbi:MAG: helix-turn-helix domain-containing protein [Nitrospira sp.]|nr:helix-turn-helix domain-containing protein [Nitrospira sp.]